MIRMRRPPHLTRYAVALIGRSTRFSTAKAREQLGWQPQVDVREGIRRTVEWYRKIELARSASDGIAPSLALRANSRGSPT
jgi:nucleoside-diphosphate-sugar epimerase